MKKIIVLTLVFLCMFSINVSAKEENYIKKLAPDIYLKETGIKLGLFNENKITTFSTMLDTSKINNLLFDFSYTEIDDDFKFEFQAGKRFNEELDYLKNSDFSIDILSGINAGEYLVYSSFLNYRLDQKKRVNLGFHSDFGLILGTSYKF